ncbi:putative membrane protein [Helicobacter pylori Hp P-11b]|uniref:Putative membrane protein n=1 Tax=Helicobacter pylori Hp P-11b TaxID=992106 RepID=J0GLP0_HELPX|nr:hypothetical protein HPHPP11_1515 [Helicobacter pylori Hp P-11]EJC26389.1 putative membrane protein [Helicobacter pylori Hp P-11b]
MKRLEKIRKSKKISWGYLYYYSFIVLFYLSFGMHQNTQNYRF